MSSPNQRENLQISMSISSLQLIVTYFYHVIRISLKVVAIKTVISLGSAGSSSSAGSTVLRSAVRHISLTLQTISTVHKSVSGLRANKSDVIMQIRFWFGVRDEPAPEYKSVKTFGWGNKIKIYAGLSCDDNKFLLRVK